MKWLLVVIIANTPVKTDLVYDRLSECLSAEHEMRKDWSEVFNSSLNNKASKKSLDFINKQMASGTCIPKK